MTIDTARWQRLSPWLDQLLAVEERERPAWLDELATRDGPLAAELRALLGAASEADDAALDRSVAQAEQAARQAGLLGPLPTHPRAGQRFGAYTLVQPLGEGGMGAVWLAERSDGRFEARAAVKLLRSDLVHRTLAARFQREGAILARLSHPHIARLIDAGLGGDGQPFLVIEHVAGERIDRWCDERRLPVRERVALFDQVLQAVQHAHAQLVVHRDLKPGNVLVDGEGRVKLLDFGIAKLIDADEADFAATELTRAEGRVLTPQYAAPEQASGGAISTATDVYALGLLLYGLLSGQHPRVDAQGRHTMKDTPLPRASHVVTDATRRPRAELGAAAAARGSTPARLAHALTGDLDNILAKALRTEPGDRYATVAAFADDLCRHLGGQTVSARPDSWRYRSSRFVARHRAGVVLAALALMAIVTAAGLAEQQRREAERERDVATRQREQAEAVVLFLGEQLGQVDEPGPRADPGQRIELAQRRAEQLFHDVPEVLVQLHGRLHAMNIALGRFEAADRIVTTIEAAAQASADSIVKAEVWCGPHGEQLGDAEAIARIDRGLALLDAGSRSRGTRSRCLFHRSSHLKSMARFDEALRDLDASREADWALPRRASSLAYLRSRALLLNELGQVHGAQQAQRQLIEQMHGAGRGHSVQMVADLHWLCIFQWRMGRPREALPSCEQARERAAGVGNKGYLRVVDAFRARMLQDLHRPQAARELLELALLHQGRVAPPFPRGVDFVARLQQLQGNAGDAVATLERDLREHGSELKDSRDTINRFELANQHVERGDGASALAVLAPLSVGFGQHTFAWDVHWLRARAHNLNGASANAEASALAAVAEADRRAPPSGLSALHGHAQLELARALAALGRRDEARTAAGRAARALEDALGEEHPACHAARALAQPAATSASRP